MSTEGPGLHPRIQAVLNGVQRRAEKVEWLKTGQVAEILYLHRNTVGYWIRTGRIQGVWTVPGPKRSTAEWRIPITEVERLMGELG